MPIIFYEVTRAGLAEVANATAITTEVVLDMVQIYQVPIGTRKLGDLGNRVLYRKFV